MATEENEFMRWAFGEDYRDLSGEQMKERWNWLHSEHFIITDEIPADAIKKMDAIWTAMQQDK